MKRERPEGRKEPFGCSFLLRRQFLSALFLRCSYFSLPFSVFSAFLLPGKADGRAVRVKKEDEKMRVRKKIFAKVPVWWQEKPANRATFAAET